MKILDTIKSPSDVKALSGEELSVLASEIRAEIIETVSKNGGHLASNLGIVELTLALHRVFSFPGDTLVFDVGHQAYAHKLITGRRDAFPTLRREGGLSGFTNREESGYDAMTAGHSGSSLSYAIGIAEANRMAGTDAYAVAVIGDGSFTNGMVYEALNNAAVRKLRLIIVLNDNEMSISRNVGALSRYFSQMRTGKAYFTFKLVVKRFFASVPFIGKGLTAGARRIKNFFKRLLITQNIFESLGLEYYGPVAGNNPDRLYDVLKEARLQAAEHGAVVVHVNTKKGLGYKPAEDSPDRFHSTAPFDPDGEPQTAGAEKKRTFTDAFSDQLVREAERDKRVCAITAAMTDGCGLAAFRARYPERFFDTGIAEEHAVSFAGGLSAKGMKPVCAVYSTFMQRTFDQMWHDVALQKGSPVFVLSHSGVVPGDGVTHQGIYDVSLFAPIPGITIYSPSCCADLEESLPSALAEEGPVVIRYPKGRDTVYPRESFTEINGGRILRFGTEKIRTLVVTYGRLAENVYAALSEYAHRTGEPCAMAVLTRIVPLSLSSEANGELYSLCQEAERILFAEEGIRTGGIGESFAARISEEFHGKPVRIRAIENGFLPHDTADGLLHRIGMDKEGLAAWFAAAEDGYGHASSDDLR